MSRVLVRQRLGGGTEHDSRGGRVGKPEGHARSSSMHFTRSFRGLVLVTGSGRNTRDKAVWRGSDCGSV